MKRRKSEAPTAPEPNTPILREPAPSAAVRQAFGHPTPPPRGQMAVLTMGRIETRARQSFPWHAHEALWEIEVQEQGVVEFGLDGGLGRAEPGDVFVYPAGVAHATWNRQSSSAFSYVIHFEVHDVPLVQRNPSIRAMPGTALCRFGRDEMLWFEQLFHQLWWEETMRHHGFELAEDALLRMIFVGLQRRLTSGKGGDALSKHASVDVMRFVNCVRDGAGQPRPLQAAAERLGVNYDSLRHRFKREIGMSPNRLLMSLRMQQAKHLLLTTQLSIKEIADRMGYADPHHFTAVFTRQVGLAPLHWRRRPKLKEYWA